MDFKHFLTWSPLKIFDFLSRRPVKIPFSGHGILENRFLIFLAIKNVIQKSLIFVGQSLKLGSWEIDFWHEVLESPWFHRVLEQNTWKHRLYAISPWTKLINSWKIHDFLTSCRWEKIFEKCTSNPLKNVGCLEQNSCKMFYC